MLRSLFAVAIAAALIVPLSADVAAARSYKRHHHHWRAFHSAPVGLFGGYHHARRAWRFSRPTPPGDVK